MKITLPGKAASLMASQRERAEKQRDALGIEARSWYRITNEADDEAELLLYDEVGGWFGATADQFIADLRDVTAKNLRVRVNSPGGSVFEGIAIANALRSHPANVVVQVDGIAASIASVIAMAGDRVEMAPNTMMMIHDASGLCMGDASDMEEMAELLDLISDNIADAYVAKAGGTRDQWRARMQAETWYLPEDAVDAGLADEATQVPKAGEPAEPKTEPGEEDPEMRRQFDFAAYGYQGPRQESTLTEDIRSLIGDEVAAQLRASAAQATEPAAPTVEDTAVAVHHTATADGTWDGGAQEKKLPSPVPVATVKTMYAWYDAGQTEDGAVPKTACKFPHHNVAADGKPGAANLAACRNGLARLSSADIPEGEREGVRKHLQAHLDDAKGADNETDVEPAAVAAEPETPAEDAWAAAVARLTQPEPDPWAAAVARFTRNTSASSAATNAA